MDDKIWSFVVITIMWAGVLTYMVKLNKKASKLKDLLDESEEK